MVLDKFHQLILAITRLPTTISNRRVCTLNLLPVSRGHSKFIKVTYSEAVKSFGIQRIFFCSVT